VSRQATDGRIALDRPDSLADILRAMAKPRRALLESKRARVVAGVGAIVTFCSVLLAGAVTSDAWTRFIDVVTRTPPGPTVDEYPIPISGKTRFGGILIPLSPEEVGSPPSPAPGDDEEILVEWGRRFGAVEARSGVVTLSMTSPKGAIVINALKVKALERGPAVAGVFVGPWGSGDIFKRAYEVDLDEQSPTPVMRSEESDDGSWSFPISLGPSDTYIAEVVGYAKRSDVSWVIEIDYVSEGKIRTVTVDDDGRPFRTTGTGSASHWWAWGEGWRTGPPEF